MVSISENPFLFESIEDKEDLNIDLSTREVVSQELVAVVGVVAVGVDNISNSSHNHVINNRLKVSRIMKGSEGIDSLRFYLNDIGEYPLPTKEDNNSFAFAMRLGLAAKTELESLSLRTSDKKREALEMQVLLGEENRDLFIKSNLRLVVSWAQKYFSKGKSLELLDLIQEGYFGLEKAVDKFDPDKGFAFSTYASWWIRQSLERGIDNSGYIIRIPGERSRLVYAVEQIEFRLEDSGLTTQSLTEIDEYIAAELSDDINLVTIQDVKDLRADKVTQRTISSNKNFTGIDDSAELQDTISDFSSDQEYTEIESKLDMENLLAEWRTLLDKDEYLLLTRRMGLKEEDVISPSNDLLEKLLLRTQSNRNTLTRAIMKVERNPVFKELIKQCYLFDDEQTYFDVYFMGRYPTFTDLTELIGSKNKKDVNEYYDKVATHVIGILHDRFGSDQIELAVRKVYEENHNSPSTKRVRTPDMLLNIMLNRFGLPNNLGDISLLNIRSAVNDTRYAGYVETKVLSLLLNLKDDYLIGR